MSAAPPAASESAAPPAAPHGMSPDRAAHAGNTHAPRRGARATLPRVIGFLTRTTGLSLLAIPLLPLPRIFGPLPGAAALVDPGTALLGLVIFAALAFLLGRVLPRAADTAATHVARGFITASSGLVVGALLVVLAGLLFTTSAVAFRHQPLLVDAVVQLFQASIFAAGRLAAPAPALPEFFLTQHMLVDEGGWYAQYPPGHSALLALGVLARLPWAIPALLTLGSAFLIYRFTRAAYDETTARLTLLLAVLCPFFWFMGASFMNHVSALFFIAAFLCAFRAWDATGRAAWMLAAGAALGAGALSRPLDCLAVGAPFAVVAAPRLLRRTGWPAALAGAVGFAATAGLYLPFNAATTGHALLPGYIKLWGSAHGLGFHESPWGDVHSPLTGLRNELIDVSLLSVFLFEWPLPALIPVGAFLAAGWARAGWDRRLLAGAAALPAVYFFYWHRDAFLGPRYLYAALPFLLPLTARAFLESARWLRGRRVKLAGVTSLPSLHTAVLATLLCFAYAAVVGVPQRFRIYETGMRSMKVDLRAEARAAGLSRALVFVPESWGSRLLARLRVRGVPAALAEKAYRRTDHCELEELARSVEAGGASGAALAGRVEAAMRASGAVEWRDLNGDPTLRLRPGGRLTPACAEELLYDRGGYAVFTPYLPANAPDLTGPLVIARDLRGANAELRARYPDRPAFLFRRGVFERLP